MALSYRLELIGIGQSTAAWNSEHFTTTQY